MYENIEKKAEYCLNCKAKPCSIKGCPLNNDIPAFIQQIKTESYKEAYKILSKTTVLPAICGRICPHYKQCMSSCIRGIKGEPVNIGALEAFVGDVSIKKGYNLSCNSNNNTKNCNSNNITSTKDYNNNNNNNSSLFNKKIAIIGGGPAGLTAAAYLAMNDNKVTIFEKYNYLGGLLVHSIPDFRLSKDIVKKSIDKILDLGVEVKYHQELGKNLHLKELEKKYDYIILAFGANISSKIGVDGEDLDGVYGANELLEYKNHPDYTNKTVVVNGGGNVAMDAARTIKRLGAKKVIVVYRRSREQMPAEQKEIADAINEGVEFLFQNNIVKIIGTQTVSSENSEIFEYSAVNNILQNSCDIFSKNKVEQIELIKTELIKKASESRLFPVNIEGSNYVIQTDYVVMAIGSHPAKFVKNLGLELDSKGYIKVNENGQTSNPKIYAIGDLAGNTSTVAWAARSGRDLAEYINKQ